MAAPPGRPRLVVGRLIMIPAFAVVVVADTFTLDRGAHTSAPDVLGPICAALAHRSYQSRTAALLPGLSLRRVPGVTYRQGSAPHNG